MAPVGRADGWTPAGRVEHLGGAEFHWFQMVVAGDETEMPQDEEMEPYDPCQGTSRWPDRARAALTRRHPCTVCSVDAPCRQGQRRATSAQFRRHLS